MILVFWILHFKPAFSLSSFTFVKRLFNSSLLSAVRVVSSAYLRLLIFLPAILIPVCDSSSLAFHTIYFAYKLMSRVTVYHLVVLLSQFWTSPVLIVASWPAHRFLRRQVRWSGTPMSLRIFQFALIHRVKGFSIVNKAEVDVFLGFSCFLHDTANVGNLISESFVFSQPSLYIWKFTYCWSWAWRILSMMLLACEMSTVVQYFEHSLALPFFGIGMKTYLFQSCGYYWVFPIYWCNVCRTLTASSFRNVNSSAGILSPPLACFIVMLPKSHLTSHSRMSSSMWVTPPLWLSRSLRPFLCSNSMFSCHFLLTSASVGSLLFLSFIVPILAQNVALSSPIFLKWSLFFPILLFSCISCISNVSSYLSWLFSGTLRSAEYIFPCLHCLSPRLFSQLSSGNHFAFFHFFFWGLFWSLSPVQCYEHLSIVLQALCLPGLLPWIYLSPPLWWLDSIIYHYQIL